jgi:hypothetical protein
VGHRLTSAKGSPRAGRQPQFSGQPRSSAPGAARHPLLRRNLLKVGVIAGCVVAGLLAGTLARWWVGGLNGQRAQLHECVVAAQRTHPSEDAGKMLGSLQAEVPDCMDTAGYAKALDNSNCGRALWQGDVYCYEPKSRFGRLLFKIANVL